MSAADVDPDADRQKIQAVDVGLIERAALGDTEAFAALYDRYSPMMLGVATRMAPNRVEAEDLLHDVFLEAWERVRDYDSSRGSVRTWLLVRLRSRALDRLGRASRNPVAPTDSGLASGTTDTEATEGGLAVREGLSTLPSEVREILELSYFLGMTGKEIAEHLDVPLGTVKSRLARGLNLLEDVLSELGGGGPWVNDRPKTRVGPAR